MKPRSVDETLLSTATSMPSERSWAAQVIEGDRSEVLSNIGNPFVTLALWHRDLPPRLDHWLRSLPPDRLPRGRLLVHKAELRYALDEFLTNSGTPRSEEALPFRRGCALHSDAVCRDCRGGTG